jgi:hypothetical protein
MALQSVVNTVLSDNDRVGWGGNLSPDPGPDVIDIHIGEQPAHPAQLASQQK